MNGTPQLGTWAIDTSHTEIGFVARHLMVTKVRGEFTSFDGTIIVADPIEESSVEVSIDAASIDTGSEERDTHLRSADFLDVDHYPKLGFTSTRVRRVSESVYEIDGDLTIRDTTRPVKLTATFDGEVSDPWGGTRIAFTASTTIDRGTWGLNWNVPLDGGGVLVSKDVTIELEVQGIKQ